jgi:chaperone required for assembly of F1-ATPase
MKGIFSDLSAKNPLDPNEAARRHMRPNLPRRFYQAASVAAAEEGFRVLLDGKPARTPARHFLAAPVIPLATAICGEWEAQRERVDPARMPLTRLANSIIDGVAASPDPVAAEVAKYLATDLVLYRAEGPDGLVARQTQAWDPILELAREVLDARFVLAGGVMFVAQPERALANTRAAIPDDPWRLGAVHTITTLTGSALIALMALRGRLPLEEAWRAAHVDEDWNMETWGRDELALERRAYRFAEMQAATSVLDALRDH